MAILYFSDVLNKVGLDPRKVKLIRHALTDKGFRDCYDKNMILEYTRLQKRGFSKDYDYGVAQIMEPDVRQSRLFQQHLHPVVGGTGAHRLLRSQRIREDPLTDGVFFPIL